MRKPWRLTSPAGRVGFPRYLLLLLVLFCTSTFAQEAPALRIGILTMTPGAEYWSRFGHNAILVVDETANTQTSYNFGYFDFDQPGFLARFLRGEMRYQLVALPAERDIGTYEYEGRGVTLQWLALTPEESTTLRDYLVWHALPENASYRYDYFTSNCSTKVRDALDLALSGTLKKQLDASSHGLTYRTEASRLGAGLAWLYLGMHAGLGPFADKPLTIWEESFVPRRLSDALARAKNPRGQPLVEGNRELLPDQLKLEHDAAPKHRWGFAFAGIGFAVALAFLLRRHASKPERIIGATLAAVFWITCGIGGVMLLALWWFTAHVAAHGNENLLLFFVPCLLLLAALPTLWRGNDAVRGLRVLSQSALAAAGFALFLKCLPFRIQSNGDFIALLLPIHAVLAWRLSAKRLS